MIALLLDGWQGEMKTLVKREFTGRKWGDRIPEKVVKYTKDGVKYKKVVNDSWAGPGSYDPDQEGYHPNGQYERLTWITILN